MVEAGGARLPDRPDTMRVDSLLETAKNALRSARLLAEQLERVRHFVRHGWDAGQAQSLLYTMHTSYRVIVKHRDVLGRDRYVTGLRDAVQRPALEAEPRPTDERKLPAAMISVDDGREPT